MKKDAIRAGGLKVFGQKGFDEASMDDIAAAAGVAKGTLYYHYRSKEALYEDILEVGLRHLIAVLEAAHAQPSSPIQKLQAVLDENLRYLGAEPDFCRLLAASASGALQTQTGLFRKIQLYFDYIESHLAQMRELGLLQPKLDLASAAAAIFGLVLMVAMRCHACHQPVFTAATRHTVLLMSQGALGLPAGQAIPFSEVP